MPFTGPISLILSGDIRQRGTSIATMRVKKVHSLIDTVDQKKCTFLSTKSPVGSEARIQLWKLLLIFATKINWFVRPQQFHTLSSSSSLNYYKVRRLLTLIIDLQYNRSRSYIQGYPKK